MGSTRCALRWLLLVAASTLLLCSSAAGVTVSGTVDTVTGTARLLGKFAFVPTDAGDAAVAHGWLTAGGNNVSKAAYVEFRYRRTSLDITQTWQFIVTPMESDAQAILESPYTGNCSDFIARSQAQGAVTMMKPERGWTTSRHVMLEQDNAGYWYFLMVRCDLEQFAATSTPISYDLTLRNPGLFFQVEFSADQRGIYETGAILTLALIVIVSVSCVCACGTRRRELPAWLARPVYCTCVVAWLLFIGEALVTTQRSLETAESTSWHDILGRMGGTFIQLGHSACVLLVLAVIDDWFALKWKKKKRKPSRRDSYGAPHVLGETNEEDDDDGTVAMFSFPAALATAVVVMGATIGLSLWAHWSWLGLTFYETIFQHPAGIVLVAMRGLLALVVLVAMVLAYRRIPSESRATRMFFCQFSIFAAVWVLLLPLVLALAYSGPVMWRFMSVSIADQAATTVAVVAMIVVTRPPPATTGGHSKPTATDVAHISQSQRMTVFGDSMRSLDGSGALDLNVVVKRAETRARLDVLASQKKVPRVTSGVMVRPSAGARHGSVDHGHQLRSVQEEQPMSARSAGAVPPRLTTNQELESFTDTDSLVTPTEASQRSTAVTSTGGRSGGAGAGAGSGAGGGAPATARAPRKQLFDTAKSFLIDSAPQRSGGVGQRSATHGAGMGKHKAAAGGRTVSFNPAGRTSYLDTTPEGAGDNDGAGLAGTGSSRGRGRHGLQDLNSSRGLDASVMTIETVGDLGSFADDRGL